MNYNAIKAVLYQPTISFSVMGMILGTAFVLGALHALGPGHGKSLMAAYLIGSRGRMADVVVLALTLTVSHVFSVVALGFIALWITDFFMPEQMSKWIGLFSGLSITAIAIWLFFSRLRLLRQGKIYSHSIEPPGENRICESEHHHEPHSHEGHAEHHHFNPKLSIRQNLALGITGGIVPCPKALVILLLAISLQKIALGILIVVVFSLGLSLVLVTIGIVMLKASHLLKGRLEDRKILFIPVFGAVMIFALGVFVSVRSAFMFL